MSIHLPIITQRCAENAALAKEVYDWLVNG